MTEYIKNYLIKISWYLITQILFSYSRNLLFEWGLSSQKRANQWKVLIEWFLLPWLAICTALSITFGKEESKIILWCKKYIHWIILWLIFLILSGARYLSIFTIEKFDKENAFQSDYNLIKAKYWSMQNCITNNELNMIKKDELILSCYIEYVWKSQ